jgi:hypothetical protein
MVLAVLVVAAAVAVLVTDLAASDPGQGAYKLEGAWIARVTTFNGDPYPFVGQWSYVVVPDPSGRRAAIHGSVDVAFPQNPQLLSDFNSPIIGEVVMTGPHTVEFNTFWYAIKKGSPVNSIVFIGRAWGEGRFLAPGKSEFTHNFEIYLPSADTDGDGLPEGAPVNTFTVTTLDTRVPSPR